jgi:hypothetical protein
VDPLLKKPAPSTSETANDRSPSLVGQHLDVSQPRGIVDGDMHLLVSNVTRGALPSITSDPMADTLESGQLFGFAMDHVSWPLPLDAHDWLFRLQVLELAEPESFHHAAKSPQRRMESLGNPSVRNSASHL